ncbi:hypothetical protein [Paenisporosarcina sp.]|uniref:hypothetical protein n=1 Tax=Paenisporosarcina sp. TaxID=1932001 RepID=UPI003C727C17
MNFSKFYSFKGDVNEKVLKLEKKIKRLSGVDFLSNIELWTIFLQSILFFLIFVTLFQEDFRSHMMLLLLFLGLVQLVGFSIRRKKSNYTKKFKIYLIFVLSYLFLFLGVVTYLYKTQSLTIFIEIITVGWIILFFTIGLINFKMSARYLFYWRLKKTFPSEGDKKYRVEVSLKKLSPYISLEKQKAYLIINYGLNFITYGFYIYLCLLIFKINEFNAIPVLEKVQNYLTNWNFINASNTIGLFSIFLALLTICVPVQQRIVGEAEKEMFEEFEVF